VDSVALVDWIGRHQALLWWLGFGSLIMFLLSPLAVAFLALRLPPDYFVAPRRQTSRLHRLHPAIWLTIVVLKNALGVVLLLAGLAMLVLPGQGLLTILMGLLLINFPGKFALERRLVSRPGVLRGINWIRRKRGSPPLIAPDSDSPAVREGRK
jgi:hypothetical protein